LYNTGNYLRASGGTSLEQRTPAQVRSDIGAMPTTGGTFTGPVLMSAGLSIDTSLSVSNNSPVYFRTVNGTGITGIYMNLNDEIRVGNDIIPLWLQSSQDIVARIGSTNYTVLTTKSSINDMADVDTTGA